MKFAKAFELMKQGEKVKLPSWGGYWYWDHEKETIMIQCRPQDADQGELLDIRETQRVEYTLINMQSDDWVIADESNCPILGGTATFTFGDAIKYVKRGLKVARKGWNGKEMYLRLIKPGNAMCDHYPMQSCIGLKTEKCEMQPGWVASQADMLADDWMIVE